MLEQERNLIDNNEVIDFNKYYDPKNILFICPKFLDKKHFSKIAEYYLPVDTGIEIECTVPNNWDKNWLDFLNPIENRSGSEELRLRIPSGLDGFNMIFNLCEHLNQKNYILTQSANHYHVDISRYEENIKDIKNDNYIISWVKNELLKWDHVNELRGNGFVFLKKKDTIEIRTGKMTFNYSEMIKDIIYSHYIVKYVKYYSNNIKNIKHLNNIKLKNYLMLNGSTLINNRVINFTL